MFYDILCMYIYLILKFLVFNIVFVFFFQKRVEIFVLSILFLVGSFYFFFLIKPKL